MRQRDRQLQSRDRVGQGKDDRRGPEDQEYGHRGSAGARAVQDPLLRPDGGRDPGGHSGLFRQTERYGRKRMINLIEKAEQQGDRVAEQHGVKLFVDPKSYLYLNGVTLDFTDGLNGTGFTFTNPNAKGTCGCGTSFHT